MTTPRHFLNLDRDTLSGETLRHILDVAKVWKHTPPQTLDSLLHGKTLAMLFMQPSTRTRLSFENAMYRLGGNVTTLHTAQSQMQRGESLKDTARVLSCYSQCAVMRTPHHQALDAFVRYSRIPVINGLTDTSHPCQVLSDIMTLEEEFHCPITECTVCWVGDGNNVANSWIHAADNLGFHLHLSCPPRHKPTALPRGTSFVRSFDDPYEAVVGCHAVITDTWFSMGTSRGSLLRRLALRRKKRALQPYQVSDTLMARAESKAVFMHCLPAYIGQEVSVSVFEGTRSRVWQGVANRMHTQKAIIAWCLDALPDSSSTTAKSAAT
ncbi:MAG: ornithine carbamoyltransferase [Alphaproteobacteria bacterium GM202ARS2]|nr:ornithine carbamoyltransferase [Alphaproteobacteria bacterium GM202ARS2]